MGKPVRKKATEPKESITSLKTQLKKESEKFDNLLLEHCGLRRSFEMIKTNYENEKKRVNSLIQSIEKLSNKI